MCIVYTPEARVCAFPLPVRLKHSSSVCGDRAQLDGEFRRSHVQLLLIAKLIANATIWRGTG
jgi:hypothetical protein